MEQKKYIISLLSLDRPIQRDLKGLDSLVERFGALSDLPRVSRSRIQIDDRDMTHIMPKMDVGRYSKLYITRSADPITQMEINSYESEFARDGLKIGFYEIDDSYRQMCFDELA